MTYAQLREQHFELSTAAQRAMLARSPREARRVHGVLIRRAAMWGAARVIGDPAGFARAVRSDLGLSGWLAPLLQGLLMRVFQILLPIVIAWLESQLAAVTADPTTGAIDAHLLRLAREANQ